uniref:PASTA domain-containing protein n=1 Tax=candidate division WOR-3 bacterium TaxID=2052148 RepID=A0A7C4XA30_UNCW3
MKKLLVYVVFILIFFIIGVFLANFVIMPAVVRSGEEIKVPDVCNIPLDSAIAILKKNNLQGVVVERRYDKIIEEDRIIIQDPLPDTKVKKGRIVHLVVSLGVETIKIPELSGIDFEKGKQIINRLGLVISDIDSILSDSIPSGKIIKTIPEPETEVKKGDEIKVIISKGIVLKMPNLLGKKVPEIMEILKSMNLFLKNVVETEGSGEKGVVIVQDPEPDKIINPGDSVSVIIIK